LIRQQSLLFVELESIQPFATHENASSALPDRCIPWLTLRCLTSTRLFLIVAPYGEEISQRFNRFARTLGQTSA
jgi:hypothetical protein